MAYEQHIMDSALESARCVVTALSDTRTEATTSAGRRIREMLAVAGHRVVESRIIRDEAVDLHQFLTDMSQQRHGRSLTNGGTGISRRDQTIEVVERHLDQTAPGIWRIVSPTSLEQIGSGAMLSRAVAGLAGERSLRDAGSTKAVELAMSRLILPEFEALTERAAEVKQLIKGKRIEESKEWIDGGIRRKGREPYVDLLSLHPPLPP